MGLKASCHVAADNLVDATTDDFDPAEQPDFVTPFGLPLGEFPMGTLAEVLGKDKADRLFALWGIPQ